MDMLRADFGDWLNMRIMSGPENYIFTLWTGMEDKYGRHIYKDDIVKYKDSVYRVIFNAPGFVLECIEGTADLFINPEELEITGNTYEGKTEPPN